MKLLLTLTALVLAATQAQAQTLVPWQQRGRIENVTNHTPTPAAATQQRRVGSQATAPMTGKGSPRVPIILVQFADTLFKVADTAEGVKAYYEDFFNAPAGQAAGPSYRSVAEYYRQQSDSLFNPRFTIIGPVTLANGYAHYGRDEGSRKDVNISQFYSEACQRAVEGDVAWSDFDNDQNGTVDFVYFIYAGEGQNGAAEQTDLIWPKESSSSLNVAVDGQTVTFGSYGCSNECYRLQPDGIGAIVHEMGHGLGLPDFYDVSGDSYGLDYFDIMDSGCYQVSGRMPCCMSAYERDFMGWRPLVALDPDSAYTLTLQPVELGGDAYKLPNPANPDEYFILENRQNHGFDTYFAWPAASLQTRVGANHGLMVTHVDYLASAWTSNRVNVDPAHQRITLVPAGGELISYTTVHTAEAQLVWAASAHRTLYPLAEDTVSVAGGGDAAEPHDSVRAAVTELSSYAVFTEQPFPATVTHIVENPDGTVTLYINGGRKEPEPEPLEEPDVPEIA